MRSEATREGESIVGGQVLYMALELSERTWKVLFAAPAGRRRERSVAARDVAALVGEIAAAKRRLGLSAQARVVSCYEAGRDGFWLDRALRANGIDNLVVDSSSIEVARRARRAKTDRVDLVKLMGLLLRWVGGERKVWSVVRVPDAEAEDIRQLSRSIERLKGEHGRHVTRIKALLATQGIKLARIGGRDWGKRVGELRRWDGSALGTWLQRDLVLEGERLAVVAEQLAALEAERDRLVAEGREAAAVKARELARLGAIASESSFVFATELFGWRTFSNRRQLAGSVGLTGPTAAARAPASRASPRPATSACARCWWRSPGAGSDNSPRARCRAGGRSALPTPAAAPAGSPSWPWRASCWWRCGATSSTASCRRALVSR